MAVRRSFASWLLLGTMLWGTNDVACAESTYRRCKVSTGYHYSIGDYGESEDTEISYVPLTITAELGSFTVQGTIPYLRISGPSGIVEGPNGPIETTDGESDGLGDLLARVSYFVPVRRFLPDRWAARPAVPWLELITLVKFPTASRSAGLGTGEFDVGIETELTWSLGRFTPFVTIGYRFLGSPPDTELRDVIVTSAGAQYRIVDAVGAGLLVDYRQAASATTGERLELVPFASWTFHAPWSLDGYASAGLADGSPDAGTGLQLSYTW